MKEPDVVPIRIKKVLQNRTRYLKKLGQFYESLGPLQFGEI
jgi:hypothetical protein